MFPWSQDTQEKIIDLFNGFLVDTIRDCGDFYLVMADTGCISIPQFTILCVDKITEAISNYLPPADEGLWYRPEGIYIYDRWHNIYMDTRRGYYQSIKEELHSSRATYRMRAIRFLKQQRIREREIIEIVNQLRNDSETDFTGFSVADYARDFLDYTIFDDVYELCTPVGEFIVESENGERISFSVEKNELDDPYNVRNDENQVIGSLQTKTNYCIVIDADKLQIGTTYKIFFSIGKWDYCDSDEHTTCFNTIIDDWVVGIGAYDPNDDEKESQAEAYSKGKGYIMPPPQYNDSKFKAYSVEPLIDSDGFEFVLYDKSEREVVFKVAWIKIEDYSAIEYEGAVGYWLT